MIGNGISHPPNLTNDINRTIALLDELSERRTDLPVQKLQNLKEVLQSQFCQNVKDVYEQVYQTINFDAYDEIHANATAKVSIWLSADHFIGPSLMVGWSCVTTFVS